MDTPSLARASVSTRDEVELTGPSPRIGRSSGFGDALSAARSFRPKGSGPEGEIAKPDPARVEGESPLAAASLAAILGLPVAGPQVADLVATAALPPPADAMPGLEGQGGATRLSGPKPVPPTSARVQQARLAAQVLASLAPDGELAETAGAASGVRTGGARLASLTDELARMLAERHGPLPQIASPPPEAPGGSLSPLADAAVQVSSSDLTPVEAGPQATPDGALSVASRAEAAFQSNADALTTLDRPPAAGVTLRATQAATARPPTRPGPATPTPAATVESPAVLRQVGDGLRVLTLGDRQTAEVQLDPETLGKVRLRLEMSGKDVRLFITTASAEVREVVAAGLEVLRRDLLAHGLHCQQVSVDVQRDSSGFGRDAHDEDNESQLLEGVDDDGGAPRGAPSSSARAVRPGGGRIDLTV